MSPAEFKSPAPADNSAPTLSFDTTRSMGGREQQRQDSITKPSLTLFHLHPVRSLLHNLQRDMIDSKAISEKLLEASQHCISILSNRDHDVGTESV